MEFKKTKKLIEGVELKKLKKVITHDMNKKENGWLMDILRATDVIKKDGDKFAQLYITTAYPGMTKGFHWHKKKVDLFCVIVGTAKLVLVDDRDKSPTKGFVNEFIMGNEGEYIVVRVPPFIKHAFKNIGNDLVYMLNCMNPAYDIDDSDDYSWSDYKID